MTHVVISCGGSLGDWAVPIIKSAEIRIGADSGAFFIIKCGEKIDYALGDFDSISDEQLILIKANSIDFEKVDAIDKDDTDSMLALKKAISLKPDTITMIGALGNRFDHSLNNIQLLNFANQNGVACEIIDASNRIRLVTPESNVKVFKSSYKYVSLIPITERVTGITLKGFQYPLSDATFEIGRAYGISNVLNSDLGSVSITSGKLLIIECND
jgi:thiamine pyrophosphokinase